MAKQETNSTESRHVAGFSSGHPVAKRIAASHSSGARRLLGAATSLPPDVLRGASRRLAICSLVMAGLCIFYIMIYTVVPLLGGPRLSEPFGLLDLITFMLLGVSLAVFFLARSARLRPQRMLDVGLLFELFLTFAVGVLIKLLAGPLQVPSNWGISELCILILIFPVIVPNHPAKTLLVSLVAASMDPLGVWLALKMGKSLPPNADLFAAYFSNYLCAFLALIPCFILNHLGREVGRAREMGSYHLTDLLGRGGMGEVWRAEHRLLAREAAIKLIRPEVLDDREGRDLDAVLQRFKLEARTTASLRSPHTIQIFDFGVTEDGTFYYVMELLNGFDLKTFVERFGPVSPGRTVQFLRQACHSLAEAHERGMIHRDIKPANIFVCRYGRDVDFVKVLDFGLAKPRKQSPDTDQLTMPGKILGTPEFMAPEQLSGDRPVDARADIYALGGVGFWLLTGQPVFRGENLMKVLIDQVRAEPVAPSTRSELEIPPALDEVVLACLAKDPSDRPQGMDHLAEMLYRALPGDGWTDAQAQTWWATHQPQSGTASSLR